MEEIFDKEELLEEYDEDLETIAHVVGIFERDCAERLPRIREAIAAGDGEALMNDAHALKGGTGNFFAGPAFGTAQKLEDLGREGNCGEAAVVLETLEIDLQNLQRALAEMSVS